MPLVSEQMPNLMNGVSQQALSMRLPSQAEQQVNGLSSIVEGTNKRQPLKHIAKIIDGTAGEAYTHVINRDQSERYAVMVFNGSLKVFDLDGTEKTVTTPDGVGYITTADPQADIRAMTIADHTFILNRGVTVAKLADITPSTPAETLLFVRSVNYDVKYTIRVDGVDKVIYRTDDAYGDEPGAFELPVPVDTTEGVDEPIPVDYLPEAPQAIREQAWEAQQLEAAVTDKPRVSLDEVTEKLSAVLAAELGTGYTVTHYSPVIHVKKNDGSDFDLEFTDSSGGIHTRAIPGKVQNFADLPVVAPHGYIVKVYGTAGDDVDDYYLKFVANSESAGMDAGHWEETAGPGVEYKLDPATMPHALIRQPDGSFTLEQVEWGEREAGDIATAPWPSFVDSKIADIFLARNRMCFLSADNVVMSRVNALYSFFPETVATLLDDGPIDVAASSTTAANLRYAVPYRKEILLFAGQTQFSIDATELLAGNPPAVKETTAYEIDPQAAPIAVGKTVFFAANRRLHNAIMEYYVIPDTDTTDAADITKHVPTYIPSGVFKIAGAPSNDMVLMLTKAAPNRAYIYKYYWNGEQKLQSSWSHWEFSASAQILSVSCINDIAYFVTQYGDGVYLESIELSDGIVEDSGRFVVRLDRRVAEADCDVAYDAENDRTSIILPFAQSDTAVEVVTRPGVPGVTEYASLQVLYAVGNTVMVEGDHTGTLFYAGLPYVFTYQFSKPVLKTQAASGGQAAVIAGRLQLNRFHVNYAGTGYFKVTVTTGNGNTYTYIYTGQILGTSSATVGVRDVEDGSFAFPVRAGAKNATITVENASFLPSYLTGAEWEGRYERNTSRI